MQTPNKRLATHVLVADIVAGTSPCASCNPEWLSKTRNAVKKMAGKSPPFG